MATTNTNLGGTMAASAQAVMDLVKAEELGNAALAGLKPEMDGLKPEQLIQVNVDIREATSIVLGNLAEIRALRGEIAKAMPSFDIERFDKLETYTLALMESHAGFKVATEPTDTLDRLVPEGERVRELLLAEAKALELRGLFDPKKLREVEGALGRKNVASDLMLLSKAFETSWSGLEGNTRVTRGELEDAYKLGLHIMRLVGVREQGARALSAATDERLRAYTLFVSAYDDVRRAVNFLRWKEGDADDIAPALHPGRTAKRKGSDAPTGAGDNANPAPGTAGTGSSAGASTGAGTNAGSGASNTGGAGIGTSSGTDAATGGADPNAGNGSAPNAGGRIPGGHPFMS